MLFETVVAAAPFDLSVASACDGWFGSEHLILDRGEHPECGVAALTVVEDLEVLEHGVGELDTAAPALPIEEFGLHPSPERLDHGIVEAIADAAHRWQQP